jgi:hypothetical protein
MAYLMVVGNSSPEKDSDQRSQDCAEIKSRILFKISKQKRQIKDINKRPSQINFKQGYVRMKSLIVLSHYSVKESYVSENLQNESHGVFSGA